MARRLFQKRIIYACLSYKIGKEINLIAHGATLMNIMAKLRKVRKLNLTNYFDIGVIT